MYQIIPEIQQRDTNAVLTIPRLKHAAVSIGGVTYTEQNVCAQTQT